MSKRTCDLVSIQPPTENVQRRLSIYSVAAAAAGVGLLSLAQPAEGSVVVTNTNLNVSGLSMVTIDLDNNGTKDFQFSLGVGGYDHSFYATVAVRPLTGGKAVGGHRGLLGAYASALASGGNIGPSAHFSSSGARGRLTIERSAGTVSGSSFYRLYGPWGNGTGDHFLGVKFLINGSTHYGWVRLSVTIRNRNQAATITQYAYETVANKKLSAGATTDAVESTNIPVRPKQSLGALALGADGLSLWPRKSNIGSY